MHANYKILIADDHSIVRTGISLLLQKAFARVSVFQSNNFDTALLLLGQEPFDLLLLDIDLPGGNTVNMVSRVNALGGGTKILMFSASDEETFAARYIRAGADGYLNKLSSEEEIIAAVRAVLETGEYISPKLKLAAANGSGNPLARLSRREYEIMALLVAGEGNLEIGNLLNIQMSTVSTYKKRIFEKLDVGNIPALIGLFRRYDES